MPRKRALLVLVTSTFLFIGFTTLIIRYDRHFNVLVPALSVVRPLNATPRPVTHQSETFFASSISVRPTVPGTSFRKPDANDASLIIVLWTPFFGTPNYLPSTEEMKCEERRCTLTSDRRLVSKSAAVVFHFSDTHLQDMPPVRNPNQRWVIFTIESPHHSVLSSYNHLMNWTATYRLDSDLVTPYGHVRKLTNDEEATRTKTKKNYAASKSKMVAWFVSNCNTPSGRERFVRELQKVIPVDVYGNCGTFNCYPKMSKECYRNVSQTYRFYLSFENSLCKDYVTEKFFHILETDMVPVVFGHANYSRIAPPNSFIDALSFNLPQQLGNFLLELSQDEARYNSYFAWKDHYTLGGYHWVCAMCQKLHDPTEKSKIYHDLRKWWNDDSHCWSWTDRTAES